MENNNHERDAEPIEAHLEAVATEHAVPIDAVGVCIRRIEDAAPALRTVIERAAAGEEVSFEASTLLLRGLFILAGTRDSASFQPFLRLLRLPQDDLEALVGDLITDGTAKIAASLFDGDVEGLLACIADRGMNEFSRDALLRAATFLTFDGQIDRDRFRRFLVAFHEDTLADDEDFVWAGWVTAIGRLGFRDLAPLVKQAWSEGKMPDRVMEWRHFEQELRDAERAPDDPERFRGSEYGYIDDVLKEMAWTTIEEAPPASSGRQSGRGYVPDMPIINPNRGVGRNDPCPCGSGKKYKKCCLGG